MARVVRRHRLNPFKVLCLVLYGNYEFLLVGQDGLISIENSPFARILRVPNCRLREYLEWLAHWGYIRDLDTDTYGISKFRVTPPVAGRVAANE